MSRQGILRVGIMGGTFDPIHFGHLLAAEEARHRFELDEVFFVPCKAPVHKRRPQVAHPEHRYAMVVLAVVSNPYFHASRVEIDRETPSYAIETIQHFYRLYGDRQNLHFITGADAVLEIFTWKDSDELVKLCRFIAVTRPGFDLSQLEKLPPHYRKSIDVLEIPGIEVSSTQIRERVRKGEPIRYLTPDAVCDYIYKHQLYKE